MFKIVCPDEAHIRHVYADWSCLTLKVEEIQGQKLVTDSFSKRKRDKKDFYSPRLLIIFLIKRVFCLLFMTVLFQPSPVSLNSWLYNYIGKAFKDFSCTSPRILVLFWPDAQHLPVITGTVYSHRRHVQLTAEEVLMRAMFCLQTQLGGNRWVFSFELWKPAGMYHPPSAPVSTVTYDISFLKKKL